MTVGMDPKQMEYVSEGQVAPSHMPHADSQGFGTYSEAEFIQGQGVPGPVKDRNADLTRLRPVQILLPLLQLGFCAAAFGLVLSMQGDSNNAALKVQSFAFLMVISCMTSAYTLGALVFTFFMPLWRVTDYHWLQKVQKVLLHFDYMFTLLLFAASCATGSMFPLYCFIGNPTPPMICYKMFGATVVGIMGTVCLLTHFWFLVSPYLWRR